MAVTDAEIERTIVALLEARAPGKTICPSDAARALADDFRPLMQPVRDVAREMVARGALEVTQSGRVVDVDTARGAIRLRLPSQSSSCLEQDGQGAVPRSS
jgi:hypothetical protein